MTIKFTKMHGCGNDYVYVNCFEHHIENPEQLAIYVSDRHFGIGSDGLVLIMQSETCDFRMRMFNADGSEAQMCGNASRCVAKYCYEKHLTSKTEFTLETLAGVKVLKVFVGEDGKVAKVRVNMGQPILRPADIPVALPEPYQMKDEVVSVPLPLPNDISQKIATVAATSPSAEICATCVSMGNPHAVIFLPSLQAVEQLPLEQIGPTFEHHPYFPARINTEFVYIYDRQHARMRVWERGSGETWACGTGSCATLVACVLNGLTDRHITLDLNGGSLELEWDEETSCVFMTGPATLVFEGILDPPQPSLIGRE